MFASPVTPAVRESLAIQFARRVVFSLVITALITSLSLTASAQTAQSGAATDTNDDPIKLDTYRVSVAVGNYAETETRAGSKIPVAIKDLPFTVQVFNSNAIADRVAKTNDDVYLYVVGMGRDAPTLTSGYNLRGFVSTDRSQLVDGLPGTDIRYSSNSTVGTERIEVIKGPASVLYGQVAPGGIVNVVTKKPMEVQQTTLTASVGTVDGGTSSFGEHNSVIGTIDTTGPLDSAKHWLYRVVLSGEDLTTYRRYSYAHNYFFLPSLTYRWSKDTSFTISGDITREKRHADDFLAFPPFNDIANLPAYNTTYQEQSDVDKDWAQSISTAFNHTFLNGWKLNVLTRSLEHGDSRKAFRTGGVTGNVISNTPIENSIVNRYYQRRNIGRGYNFVDMNAFGEVGPEKWRHTILVGINGGLQRNEGNFKVTGLVSPILKKPTNYYDPVLGVTPYPPDDLILGPMDTRVHNWDYAAYFSDRFKVAPRLNALVGLRYNQLESHSIEVVSNTIHDATYKYWLPQGGLVYTINDNISSYVSYSESFKPVLVEGTFVAQDGSFNFQPETGNQIEVGLKSEFMDKKLVFNVAAYDITKDNVLTKTSSKAANGLTIAATIGQQVSRGIEFETIWHPIPNWQIQGGFTIIDAKTTKADINPALVGTRFVNVARQSGNFWTRYNAPKGHLAGLGVGLGVIYQGPRLGGQITDFAGTLVPNSAFPLGGYTRVDMALYYKWRRYDFALNVGNLLDRKYISSTGEVSVFPGDPRQLTFTVKLKL